MKTKTKKVVATLVAIVTLLLALSLVGLVVESLIKFFFANYIVIGVFSFGFIIGAVFFKQKD